MMTKKRADEEGKRIRESLQRREKSRGMKERNVKRKGFSSVKRENFS